jgi:hypothetical protein
MPEDKTPRPEVQTEKSASEQKGAPKAQSHEGDVNHAIHMRGGEYVQGPQPKEPAKGTKSVVVQTPTEVEEYPEGTHEPAPPEEQFWSQARVEKYNQLSPEEKNAPYGEREL